eukprot:3434405-Lingulodinium_polyedra.AAC.1
MCIRDRLLKASRAALADAAKRAADDHAKARRDRAARDMAGPQGDSATYRALRTPSPGPATIIWAGGQP